MPFCVVNPNIPNEQAPETFEELVRFVEFVRTHPNSIFVQISGYGEEVVRNLADHFGCNFFSVEEMKSSDLNPFTIIYINTAGEVLPRCINEKSKLIIYARRPIHHHH
jgi:hypothetical protein